MKKKVVEEELKVENFIKIIIGVIAVFALFYAITYFVTNKNKSNADTNENIQYALQVVFGGPGVHVLLDKNRVQDFLDGTFLAKPHRSVGKNQNQAKYKAFCRGTQAKFGVLEGIFQAKVEFVEKQDKFRGAGGKKGHQKADAVSSKDVGGLQKRLVAKGRHRKDSPRIGQKACRLGPFVNNADGGKVKGAIGLIIRAVIYYIFAVLISSALCKRKEKNAAGHRLDASRSKSGGPQGKNGKVLKVGQPVAGQQMRCKRVDGEQKGANFV